MRAISILRRSSSGEEFLRVFFPSAGFLTNMFIQLAGQRSESPNSDTFQLSFSPEKRDYQASTIDTDLLIQPRYGKGYHYDLLGMLENPDGEENTDEEEDQYYMKDFDPRARKVKKGEVWYLQVRGPSNSQPEIVVLQYDYVPYKNAEYHTVFHDDSLGVSDDFNLAFQTPVSLKNLKGKITITSSGSGGNTDLTGHVNVYLLKGTDQVVPVEIDTGITQDSQLIKKIPFSSASIQEESIFMKYLGNNDRIVYDMSLDTGTLANVSLTIDFKGYVNEIQNKHLRLLEDNYFFDMTGARLV